MTLSRLSRALTNTTLDEALEDLEQEDGVETKAEDQEDLESSGEVCERMLDDLRMARSSAENSIYGGIEQIQITFIFFLPFQEQNLIQRRGKERWIMP